MKRKVWELTVLDNPNRAIGGESDIFYTTDTEAFLIFRLTDEDFNPVTATLTLINTSDKSVISETVPVIDKEIEWEMTEDAIVHSGNWQAQLVYTQEKDGKDERYTSQVVQFDVQSHLMTGRQPSLVAIEDWNTFMATAEEWLAQLEEDADGVFIDIDELEQQYRDNEQGRVEAEDIRETNESTRQAEESQRVSSESTRVDNEQQREANEQQREEKESLRESSETDRVSAEQNRVTAENERASKEEIRVLSEAERLTSETSRVNAENRRVSNETDRIDNEDERSGNEEVRANAESQRELNEDERSSSEQQRASSEQQREENESLRESSETEREGAEQNRVTAENERNDLHDLVQQKLKNGEFIGEKGDTGDGLEYVWNGTQLGVRKEGGTEYVYVDLKGEKGDTGEMENLDSTHIVDALGYVPISATDVPDPTWANLQDKPTEFNPASHTHDWEEVTDKPSTFTPSTHTHSIDDVTGLRAELDSVPELTKENVGLGNVDNIKQASKVEHDQLASDFSEHQADLMPHLTADGNYKYGLKTNTAKNGLIFVYEGV